MNVLQNLFKQMRDKPSDGADDETSTSKGHETPGTSLPEATGDTGGSGPSPNPSEELKLKAMDINSADDVRQRIKHALAVAGPSKDDGHEPGTIQTQEQRTKKRQGTLKISDEIPSTSASTSKTPSGDNPDPTVASDPAKTPSGEHSDPTVASDPAKTPSRKHSDPTVASDPAKTPSGKHSDPTVASDPAKTPSGESPAVASNPGRSIALERPNTKAMERPGSPQATAGCSKAMKRPGSPLAGCSKMAKREVVVVDKFYKGKLKYLVNLPKFRQCPKGPVRTI